MAPDTATPMNDLMARVGYLFLHWGFLENRLRSKNGDLSSLRTRPDVQEARRIRNLIAHGIINASAEGSSPSLLCKSNSGAKDERVTYEQLGGAIGALERARFNLDT